MDDAYADVGKLPFKRKFITFPSVIEKIFAIPVFPLARLPDSGIVKAGDLVTEMMVYARIRESIHPRLSFGGIEVEKIKLVIANDRGGLRACCAKQYA